MIVLHPAVCPLGSAQWIIVVRMHTCMHVRIRIFAWMTTFGQQTWATTHVEPSFTPSPCELPPHPIWQSPPLPTLLPLDLINQDCWQLCSHIYIITNHFDSRFGGPLIQMGMQTHTCTHTYLTKMQRPFGACQIMGCEQWRCERGIMDWGSVKFQHNWMIVAA